MEPLISVIIPCYNHGEYLSEAIESIELSANNTSVEIIIVNDGSTDLNTISILKNYEIRGYHIIHQQNQGLAKARNNAIKKAKGKYIIPLDSDDQVSQTYFTEALDILEKNPSIDVVYGKPLFFGDEDGLRTIGMFQFSKIISGNYIDACAIYRKSVWEKVKGYDAKMPAMGHEDWEFWINIYLHGGNFYYLDKLCFYYRSLPNSMAKTTSTPNQALNLKYIKRKHFYKIKLRLLKEQKSTYNKIEYIFRYIKTKIKSTVRNVSLYSAQ